MTMIGTTEPLLEDPYNEVYQESVFGRTIHECENAVAIQANKDDKPSMFY